MNNDEVKFIDRLYKDLYLSDSLKKHTTSKDKYKSIKEYIEFLESIHNKVVEHNHIDTLKKMYYDKYVIKEEDIPDSYYKHEQEIALERGFGHIEIGHREKEELNNVIINDQSKSLNNWLDYFLSEDSSYIPFWAKYWAFQGMLKLGNFNKETGKYTKRTKHTVSKFADLNREALALSIDTLLKYLNKETINDKELEQLVKSGSFQSIYTYITNKILSDGKSIIKQSEGKWIKYNRGSDPTPLVKSLEGYNTGWCTAGLNTAATQLEGGDFYVYYTKDENDEYKVPRIAIRMEGNSIGEIRGVAEKQNLEPEMEDVVKEKIKDFPDKDKYYKRVSDMETLTIIYKKNTNNEELTKEELTFLYEMDSEIEGFGYDRDPRIEEILKTRNIKKDISIIKDLDESQIAISINDLHVKKEYFYGDLNLSFYDELPANIIMPNEISGDLLLKYLVIANNLELPKKVDGSINLSSLLSVIKIKLPEECGSLYLKQLKNFNELKCPKIINGDLDLSSIETLDNVELPEIVTGRLILRTLKLENYKLPNEIGILCLYNLFELKNIDLSSVHDAIHLGSVLKLENVIFPNEINSNLCLNSLVSAKGIKLPNKVGGDLYLTKLNNAEGIELPEIVGKELYLSSLKTADNLKLPTSIGALYMDNLVDARNLKLPKNIRSFVSLRKLSKYDLSLNNLPDELNYTIHLKDRILTPENFKEWKEKECNYGKEKRRNN